MSAADEQQPDQHEQRHQEVGRGEQTSPHRAIVDLPGPVGRDEEGNPVWYQTGFDPVSAWVENGTPTVSAMNTPDSLASVDDVEQYAITLLAAVGWARAEATGDAMAPAPLPPYAPDLFRLIDSCRRAGREPTSVRLPTSSLRAFGPLVTFYGLPVEWVAGDGRAAVVIEVGS